MRVYCVISIETGEELYSGPCIAKAAMALNPGTVFGWGPSHIEARNDAMRRAKAFV